MSDGTPRAEVFDLERVVCRLTELDCQGARAFTVGGGDWPLKGFVVRVGDAVRGYVNRCPHAAHPLNLLPDVVGQIPLPRGLADLGGRSRPGRHGNRYEARSIERVKIQRFPYNHPALIDVARQEQIGRAR